MKNQQQPEKIQQQPEKIDVVTLTLDQSKPGMLFVRGKGTPHEILAYLNEAAETMRAEAAAQTVMHKLAQAKGEKSRILVPG